VMVGGSPPYTLPNSRARLTFEVASLNLFSSSAYNSFA
jgi:hypothetical protein